MSEVEAGKEDADHTQRADMTQDITKHETPPPAEAVGAEDTPDPRRWGLGQVWAGLGVGLGASTLTTLVAIVVIVLQGGMDTTLLEPEGITRLASHPGVTLSALLGLWVGFGGSVYYSSYRKGQRSLRKDFLVKFTKKDLLLGLGVGLGLRALEAGLLYLLEVLGLDVLQAENSALLSDQVSNTLAFLLVGVAAGVGAPYFEEIFFRGLFLQSLLKRKPWLRHRTWSAIIITSVTFGLLHGTPDASGPILVLITGTIGGVLAYMTIKSGRLGGAIVAHAVFNTSAVLLILLGHLIA